MATLDKSSSAGALSTPALDDKAPNLFVDRAHSVDSGETGHSKEEALLDYHAQPWYRKPVVQVVIVSFTCFLCPGMFNALSGLGGGGMQDAETVNNGNVALYSTFAVFGFFGGTICNKIGHRLTLFIGSLGYGLYMLSLYLSTQTGHQWAQDFIVACGAILGVCAGLLWTAQGSIMMAYATEARKGTYIALFWAIFNFGAVIGAIIPLARNWTADAGSVDSYTYLIFMSLCFAGAFLPFTLSPVSKVVLPDGKPVAPPRHPTWKSELNGLWMALKFDISILLLFPLFFASNYFYTFNALNGSGYFGLRARSLNNFLYWTSQIVAAGVTGLLLDLKMVRRRFRALVGWASLLAFCMIVFGGDYAVTNKYTRASVLEDSFVPVDVYDKLYPGYAFLYIFNGMLDASWQTYVYWLMGAMSNDPRKLAYFAGWYKGLQSAGAAIAWRVDALKTPFMTELISTWALCVAVLVIALPQIWIRVHNHTIEKAVDEAGDVVAKA